MRTPRSGRSHRISRTRRARVIGLIAVAVTVGGGISGEIVAMRPAAATPRQTVHHLGFPDGVVDNQDVDGFRALEVADGIAVADRALERLGTGQKPRLGDPAMSRTTHRLTATAVAELVAVLGGTQQGALVLDSIRDLAPLDGEANRFRRWSHTRAVGLSPIRVVLFPSEHDEPLSNLFALNDRHATDGVGTASALRFNPFVARAIVDSATGGWFVSTPPTDFVHELVHTAHNLAGASAQEVMVDLFTESFDAGANARGERPDPRRPSLIRTSVEEPLTTGSPSDLLRVFRSISGPGKQFSTAEYPAQSAANPFLERSAREAAQRARAGAITSEELDVVIARDRLARENPTENSYRREVGLAPRQLYLPGRLTEAGRSWIPLQVWKLRDGYRWSDLNPRDEFRMRARLVREFRFHAWPSAGC